MFNFISIKILEKPRNQETKKARKQGYTVRIDELCSVPFFIKLSVLIGCKWKTDTSNENSKVVHVALSTTKRPVELHSTGRFVFGIPKRLFLLLWCCFCATCWCA